jgi:LEA14-like dessication related protein
MKSLLRIIPCLLIIVSCKFSEPRITGAKAFEFVDGAGGKKALKVDVRIENPNGIGFKLRNPAIELLINDKPVSSAYTDRVVKVKAKSNEYHSIYAQTDLTSFGKLLDLAGSILTTGGVKLTIRGNVRVKVLFIGKNLTFEESKMYSLKDFLKL